MKAMILAAGVGSRLGELTQNTPKCLMQVGQKTILEHVIEQLKRAEVSAIAINVHHHAEKVVEFLESHKNFGLTIEISREAKLLDTGGGLKKVAPFFEDENAFIVHNADVFSTIDLAALVELHRSRSAIGTLAVLRRPSSHGLYLSPDNHLVGWTSEKVSAPTPSELFGFCGISVASHRLFAFMRSEPPFSIIESYLSAARETSLVWGHPCPGAHWIDIGTPEQLAVAQRRSS